MVVVLVDEGKVGALGAQAQVVENNIALSVVESGSVGSSLLSLFDGGQNVVTTVTAATVAEVFHHLLVGSLDILRVVCTAVIEVGDLCKLLGNGLWSQLDVNREAVATAALPASAAEPTAATLKQTLGGVGLRANVGAEKNHQRRNVVGLEGLDHLLGHDRSSHVGTGVGSNGVNLDVVLSSLQGKSSGESEDTEFLLTVSSSTSAPTGKLNIPRQHSWPVRSCRKFHWCLRC